MATTMLTRERAKDLEHMRVLYAEPEGETVEGDEEPTDEWRPYPYLAAALAAGLDVDRIARQRSTVYEDQAGQRWLVAYVFDVNEDGARYLAPQSEGGGYSKSGPIIAAIPTT